MPYQFGCCDAEAGPVKGIAKISADVRSGKTRLMSGVAKNRRREWDGRMAL